MTRVFMSEWSIASGAEHRQLFKAQRIASKAFLAVPLSP